MKPRLVVPPLSAHPQLRLHPGVRSAEAFPVRRCPILRASARRQAPSPSARPLGCTAATVRNALHACARAGPGCGQPKSSRPHAAPPFLEATPPEARQDLLPPSPRRFGQPTRLGTLDRHAWTAAEPLRRVEQTRDRADPDRKAVCCCGLRRADTDRMRLRFVAGRPVRQVTEDCLARGCQRLAAEGTKALRLVGDNARWPISQRVRSWRQAHNRPAQRDGGARLVVWRLPSKSAWLNPIEPKWAHGKRAIVEPERLLTGRAVERRVGEYYGCDQEEPLTQVVVPKQEPSTRKKVA